MATRTVRWVEGFKDGKQTVHWNQLKKAKHPTKDKDVEISTDRRLNFVVEQNNPNFIPVEERKKGIRLTSEQTKETTRRYRFPKLLREELQKGVDAIIALLEKMSGTSVERFFYSAETGEVRYTELHSVEGTEIREEETTTDESVVELCDEFINLLAEKVSSSEKPLDVAETQVVSAALEEPEEPEEP